MICKAWVQVFIDVVVGRLRSEPESWKYRLAQARVGTSETVDGLFSREWAFCGKAAGTMGRPDVSLKSQYSLRLACGEGPAAVVGRGSPTSHPFPLRGRVSPLELPPGTKSGGEGGRGTGGK